MVVVRICKQYFEGTCADRSASLVFSKVSMPSEKTLDRTAKVVNPFLVGLLLQNTISQFYLFYLILDSRYSTFPSQCSCIHYIPVPSHSLHFPIVCFQPAEYCQVFRVIKQTGLSVHINKANAGSASNCMLTYLSYSVRYDTLLEAFRSNRVAFTKDHSTISGLFKVGSEHEVQKDPRGTTWAYSLF